MKTSSCKNKGRELQKYVAKEISTVFSLDEGDCVSRPMGSSGVDIMLSPFARQKFPFSIECKNTKTFPSVSALEQSRKNTYNGTTPCVVWKPPRKSMEECIVYFNFVDFLTRWKD